MCGELAGDPRGRAELAAAVLALEVQAIVRRALEENPKSASEVADLVGVTEDREALIRDGDGNVSISTLAKVMSATGKRVRISVESGQSGGGRGMDKAVKCGTEGLSGFAHTPVVDGPARTASSAAVTRSVSRFKWRMGVTQSRLVTRLRECDSLRAVIDGHGDAVFANCGLLVVRVIDSGIVDVRKSHVWIGSCLVSALLRLAKSLG